MASIDWSKAGSGIIDTASSVWSAFSKQEQERYAQEAGLSRDIAAAASRSGYGSSAPALAWPYVAAAGLVMAAVVYLAWKRWKAAEKQMQPLGWTHFLSVAKGAYDWVMNYTAEEQARWDAEVAGREAQREVEAARERAADSAKRTEAQRAEQMKTLTRSALVIGVVSLAAIAGFGLAGRKKR